MTQENKELLFKDLCARLPYHVRCKVWLKYGTTEEGPLDLEHNYGDVLQDAFFYHDRIKDIKPYLRPMSSMTEEEKLKFYGHTQDKLDYCEHYFEVTSLQQDFLLENHFDFRGLIPKDLALSTDEYNPYKE